MDPDSFANIVRWCGDILHIIPLDCTDYAPITRCTLKRLSAMGSKYHNDTNNDFIKNIYSQFIRLLGDTPTTINTKLYMWNIVATMLFLDKPMDQQYISPNVTISWTGRIVDANLDDNHSNRCIVFNYIDYEKLLHAIIDSIFFPNSRISDGMVNGPIHRNDNRLEYFTSSEFFNRYHC